MNIQHGGRAQARRLGIGLLCVLTTLVVGCGEFHEVWRDQALPSGRTVKVTAVQLAWGVEHDEPRRPDRDCFTLRFVYSAPEADAAAHDREAREVFELLRHVSDQWGLGYAELMAYQALDQDRPYDLYLFQRGPDGNWSGKFERRI